MPEIPGGLRFRALFQTLRLPHGDFSFLSSLLRTLFFRARFFSRLFPREHRGVARVRPCTSRGDGVYTLPTNYSSSSIVVDGIPNERVKVTGEIRPEQLWSRVGHNHGINLSICLRLPLLILILLAFSILFHCFLLSVPLPFFTLLLFSRFTNAWNTLSSLSYRFYARQSICCCLY